MSLEKSRIGKSTRPKTTFWSCIGISCTSTGMEKVILRIGSLIALAVLVLASVFTVVAQAQLPPRPADIGLPPAPKPIGLPPNPVDIGLPPTPKAIGLPPAPDDIGLPRSPAPMGSSPAPATVELPPGSNSLKSDRAGAQACVSVPVANVKTDTMPDGRLKLPVTVEGRPMSFILDTGGTQTTINWEKAKEFGLAPKQTGQKIVGVAGTVMDHYVATSNFSLGEMHITNLPIYVEARNLAGADGTLAPDVMRGYDVDIDFSRNSLSLISQNHCPGLAADRTTTGSVVIPMFVTGNGHVRFPVKIDGHEIMATLDTGSSVTFMSMKAVTLLGVDPKEPEMRLVRDTGTYQIFRFPFQSLDFGRVSIGNPPIAIFSDNFLKDLGTDMVLGANVLRHMHLYIAYGEKRLYITAPQAN